MAKENAASSSSVSSSPPSSWESLSDPFPDLLDCCLDVMEKTGWRGFSLESVALSFPGSLGALQTHFPSPERVIEQWFEQTDRKVSEMASVSLEASLEEMLLELLMLRFESLFKRRSLASRLLGESVTCPALAFVLFRGVYQTLSRFVSSTPVVPSWDILVPLCAIYGAAFRVWETDETPDLSRTLVALHKGFQQGAPFFAPHRQPSFPEA